MQTSGVMSRENAKMHCRNCLRHHRHCERSEAIAMRHNERMDCFVSLAMTADQAAAYWIPRMRGVRRPSTRLWRQIARTTLATRMPSYTNTTAVNTPVTTSLYPLPTISPLSRAGVEWVACHVAFEDSGLGGSAGCCRPVRARRVIGRPAALHRDSGHIGPDRHALLAGASARQFHQRSRPRDRTGPDLGKRGSRRLHRHRRSRHGRSRRLRKQFAPATGRDLPESSEADPVIYLSRDGPADYRIFVSSKSFSVRDAAALIVGARGAAPSRRGSAASL